MGEDSHIDHCLSFLLQAIRCHGDMGLIMQYWDEDDHQFRSDFNFTRQCRNFDDMHDWAISRRSDNVHRVGPHPWKPE